MTLKNTARVYDLLKEISILNQLATAEFNRTLPEGLHVSHFTVVEHLARQNEGQTPQDLADVFQTSKQNMTHTIAQLSKRGFVSIEPNPEDGRSKLIVVTPAGIAFRERAVADLEPLLTEIFEHEAFAELDGALPAFGALRQFFEDKRRT